MIIYVAPSPVWPRPIRACRHQVALRGLTPPIPPPPHACPPHARHPPPASACPLPPRRSHRSRPGGGGSRASRCSLSLGGHGAQKCDCHSLLHPAKTIGDPVGGDPLCLIPGGIICQDAPFEYEDVHDT